MVRGLADLEIGYTAKRAEKEKAERKAALLKHKDETAEEITVHVTTLYYQPVAPETERPPNTVTRKP